MKLEQSLKAMQACKPALEYGKGKELADAWDACEKGSWLFELVCRKLKLPQSDELERSVQGYGVKLAKLDEELSDEQQKQLADYIRTNVDKQQMLQAYEKWVQSCKKLPSERK